jgi:glycosyltransferase involved in cell wall biosynthesis
VWALNAGQVIVAARAGVGGFPELRDQVNCRLVDKLEQMAPAVRELLQDGAQRQRLGTAARETFESSFTLSALRQRCQQTLAMAVPAL